MFLLTSLALWANELASGGREREDRIMAFADYQNEIYFAAPDLCPAPKLLLWLCTRLVQRRHPVGAQGTASP
ncbi:hypothetical protein A6P39_003175 [Streptomyces sp. FXJ1.172]|uniref:hypothetical protein n=1 Tax=Streptomyces sp. FXJ1.172 TaxID=710705 RepID=UPI0007CFE0B2|nr:hypothetical protein [Streptomyces sp. FXJ1.172]WEO93144.1 hypothetical protein A6P39_003175 [Streptomyces sp. FXJ1.172]